MKRRKFLYLSAGSAVLVGGFTGIRYMQARGPLISPPFTSGELDGENIQTLSSLCELFLPGIDQRSIRKVENILQAQCREREGYFQGLRVSAQLVNEYSADYFGKEFVSLSTNDKETIVSDILWNKKLFGDVIKLNRVYEKLSVSKARRVFYRYTYQNLARVVYGLPVGWKQSVNYDHSPGLPAPDAYGYTSSKDLG